MHAARHPCKKHAALLFMCMSLPADAASMLTGELKKKCLRSLGKKNCMFDHSSHCSDAA